METTIFPKNIIATLGKTAISSLPQVPVLWPLLQAERLGRGNPSGHLKWELLGFVICRNGDIHIYKIFVF